MTMNRDIEVKKLTEISNGISCQIRRYIQNLPAASIYHLPDWCDIAKNVFGKNYFYYLAMNKKGDICGVLPLIHMKSRLFGDYCVSMPYFNYGSAVADSAEIEQLLIGQAINDIENTNSSTHIEFRDTRIRSSTMPVRTDKVAMLLDLPDSVSQLRKGFGTKIRAQIKRPVREGAYCEIGGIDLLSDFYKVFSRNMRDLGTPVYPITFFSEILNKFPDNSFLVNVYIRNTPVAAGFLVQFRKTMEIPWASTVKEFNRYGVNMFMYSSVLEFAIERDCSRFDFGRSSKDSGTYRFKKQWGAEEKQLYWHYWLQDGGDIPMLNPNNKKYRLLIDAWKKLPLPLANIIGPHIVKHLP